MKENDNQSENFDEIEYLIWTIFKYLQRAKHKLLEEYGITTSQLELLGAIYHISRHDIEVTQILLSQKTGIDPMTTSTILRTLQKKGLINRHESKTDTRARIVEVTDAGSELFEKATVKIKEGRALFLKKIDCEALKNQLQILLQAMNHIKQNSKQLNIN